MEKPFLTWTAKSSYSEAFTCFASNSEYIITGNSYGKLTIIGLYEFTLSSDPVTSIYHINSNIFGIVQSQFTILEVSSFYKIIKTIQTPIQGYYKGYY